MSAVTIIIWFLGCFIAITAGIYTNKFIKKIFRNELITWLITMPIGFILGIIYLLTGKLFFFITMPTMPNSSAAIGQNMNMIISLMMFVLLGTIAFIMTSSILSLMRKIRK